MSSMIIPIGFGGAGASGGGSFIQVYADLPTFLQGKYMTVSLNNEDLYADSIPTDVNMVNLQITEAGTYSIKLYTSSSSSSPLETHTVLVNSLTANYSVKVGENIYFDDATKSYSYYEASTSNWVYSPSTTTCSGAGDFMTKTWTASYSGFVSIYVFGTFTATSTQSNYKYSFYARVSENGAMLKQSNVEATSGTKTLSFYIDMAVEAGHTYTIYLYGYNGGATISSGTNIGFKIGATHKSYTTTRYVGISSKGVKSVQTGSVSASPSNPVPVVISNVNPDKSLVLMTSSSTVYYKKPEYPSTFNSVGSVWTVIEFY